MSRYLIGSREPTINPAVADSIKKDPTVKVLKALGSEDDPRTFVVEMTDDKAEQLKTQFKGLIVEQDQSLDLL